MNVRKGLATVTVLLVALSSANASSPQRADDVVLSLDAHGRVQLRLTTEKNSLILPSKRTRLRSRR